MRLARQVLLFGFVAYTFILLAISVGLGEVSTRVHPSMRLSAPDEMARSIATSTGGEWRNAEMRSFDGTQLSAWLFTPQHPNGHAVIAMHGVGDSRRGVLGHAHMLVRNGYTVLTPDSRAHGLSGGDFFTYGVLERDDTKAWVDWLVANVQPVNVYGLGESMGAANLIQSLPGDPRIKAIVAEAPFHSFEEIGYERVKQFGLGLLIPWPMLEPSFLYIRFRNGTDLKLASPAEAMQKSRTPVLIIVGSNDRNILPQHGRNLYREAQDHAEIWELPGVTHTLALGSAPKEFERRVVEWFQRH